MLKIKNNVDLKELEKFGFVYISKIDKYEKYFEEDEKINIKGKTHSDSGEIFICGDSYFGVANNGTLNILFDLIQAGLVEKVGEEEWKK